MGRAFITSSFGGGKREKEAAAKGPLLSGTPSELDIQCWQSSRKVISLEKFLGEEAIPEILAETVTLHP